MFVVLTKARNSFDLEELPQQVRRFEGENYVQWTAPPSGVVKINFDGAFDSARFCGGIGVVVRDDHGRLLLARMGPVLAAKSALMMEALTFREAVFVALRCGYTNVVFQGDSKVLVDIRYGYWDYSSAP